MANELKELLVSGKQLDQKLVADILKPYLMIDTDTNDIRPLKSWNDLKANSKILLFLLAKKAMLALEMPIDEEKSSATEIMQKTGLKKGTVNPALRKLFEDRVIIQSEDKKYSIPNFSIEQIKGMITS